jgi:hypothetical protein
MALIRFADYIQRKIWPEPCMIRLKAFPSWPRESPPMHVLVSYSLNFIKCGLTDYCIAKAQVSAQVHLMNKSVKEATELRTKNAKFAEEVRTIQAKNAQCTNISSHSVGHTLNIFSGARKERTSSKECRMY